jgi:hypothetical protein
MQAGGGNNVNLIPVMNGNQFNKWEMSLNKGAPKGPGSYPHIGVPQGPTATITFTIVGNPNSTIAFAPTVPPPPQPGSGPIYVQAGNTKPTSGVDAQFAYTVSPDGKILTVTDTNQHSGPYSYVLNFANNIPSVDPIIDNGGPSLSHNDYVWYAAGALVLLVVLWLVLKRKPSQPGPVE